MLDQARVAFGYVYRGIRSPFCGKQPLAGTGMMADGVVHGPSPEHDRTNRNAARCSPHRIAHLIQGKDRANTSHWAARPEDNGIGGVKSGKRGGGGRSARNSCLPHRWLRFLLHIPLLEMQHPAILQHDMCLAWLVAGRNHFHVLDSEATSELPSRFSQRQAGLQQISAEKMEGKIQIADVKPRPAVKGREGVANTECLAAQPPPRGLVPEPCQRVEDGIHIGANPQPEPREVVAHIGDHSKVTGWYGVAHGRDEPGTPETTAENGHAGKRWLSPRCLRHRFVHKNGRRFHISTRFLALPVLRVQREPRRSADCILLPTVDG